MPLTDQATTQAIADAIAAALIRIQELTGCLEDTQEEQDLIALINAVELWEAGPAHNRMFTSPSPRET